MKTNSINLIETGVDYTFDKRFDFDIAIESIRSNLFRNLQRVFPKTELKRAGGRDSWKTHNDSHLRISNYRAWKIYKRIAGSCIINSASLIDVMVRWCGLQYSRVAIVDAKIRQWPKPQPQSSVTSVRCFPSLLHFPGGPQRREIVIAIHNPREPNRRTNPIAERTQSPNASKSQLQWLQWGILRIRGFCACKLFAY